MYWQVFYSLTLVKFFPESLSCRVTVRMGFLENFAYYPFIVDGLYLPLALKDDCRELHN